MILGDVKELKIDKSQWTPVKFGDVVFEPKETAKDPQAEGIEHVVGLEHIDSENIHLVKSANLDQSTTFTKKFAVKDVLFGRRRAYLKKAAQASFDGICSGDITVLRAKDNLLPELLPFIVQNEKFFDYAIKHSAGGLSPRVKFKDLANYEFFLPPKDQQLELAELLWAMDEVIRNEKGLLWQATKLFKSSEKKLFSNTEFERLGILDVASVKRGKFTHRPRNAPQFYGGNIPFIQTSEVVNAQKYIVTYSQTLNELGLSISKMFSAGTIVMTIAANIGYVGILSFDSAFTDSLIGITAKPDKIEQEYLYYYLNFKQKNIDALATESAQKNLSIDTFKGFKVSFPKNLVKQKTIVADLNMKRDRIVQIKSTISASKSLQKSLINQVF